jgi:hypothetical protein
VVVSVARGRTRKEGCSFISLGRRGYFSHFSLISQVKKCWSIDKCKEEPKCVCVGGGLDEPMVKLIPAINKKQQALSMGYLHHQTRHALGT